MRNYKEIPCLFYHRNVNFLPPLVIYHVRLLFVRGIGRRMRSQFAQIAPLEVNYVL